nr:MAG TPA: NICKEL-COBALT-CADMIUM RESISTANCE PROTEIN NCCX BINDING PROTEIN, MEMBRANE PROTEIN [Caudoviricetes sp.]
MNTSDELEIRFWAIMTCIKALKKSLTPEQLDLYKDSIQESKQRFLKHRPDISQEFLERIDKFLL